MKFLNGLLENKSASTEATSRALSGVNGNSFSSITSGNKKWDIQQALDQAYERSIWVYRCVDAIATNSAFPPMTVKEWDAVDGITVEDKYVHRLFNHRPNSYETSKQFRYRLASQLLLSRTGAFVEVVWSKLGHPLELHLLNPTSVRPIPNPETYVSGYMVKTGSRGELFVPPKNIIWIRTKPHPTDPYAQTTPLISAGIAADTDYLARLFNRNFLLNDGRPGMLVGVRGDLSKEDAEELRRRFSGGPNSAGSTTVIEADGLDVNDMSANPRDAMYLESISGSKQDILLAFGVAESVLGNSSGRTFDNADSEFEIFWTTTMVPFLDAMGAGFDVLTSGGLKDNLIVGYDYSKVDVLQRRARERHDKAMAEYQAGLMTIDQYLDVVGRKPFDVSGTRVLWLPSGKVPVGHNDADTKSSQLLTQVGMGAQPAGMPIDAPNSTVGSNGFSNEQNRTIEQQRSRALSIVKTIEPLKEVMPPLAQGLHTEVKSLKLGNGEQSLKTKTHPYEGDRLKEEAEINGVISAWSRRQLNTTLSLLGDTKSLNENKTITGRYVVDVHKWADELLSELDDVLKPMAKRYAQRTARELHHAGVINRVIASGNGNAVGRSALDRLTGDSAISQKTTVDEPIAIVKKMIYDSATKQSEKVVELIHKMDSEGASLDEIKKAVRSKIGSRSSWKKGLSIAITTAVAEGSRNAVLDHAGVHVTRKWVAIKDEKTRPTHRKASGQIKSGGKYFDVGGSKLLYPGDPTAPIVETANCRCWVEWDKSKRKRATK